MKKFIIIALIFAYPLIAVSQPADFGNWLIYLGNKKIDNDWNLHNEIQYRNYNAIGDLEQLLLRAGLGYNLTEKNNNILLGYGFINSQNYIDTEEKIGINEHRIYQQFIAKQSIGILNVQHRYRFEQRFIEEQDMKLRFRYFLSINIPLSDIEMNDNTLYASIYNEIFLNSENNVFDRNRLYAGLGYKLSEFAKFEIGYMNQFLSNGNRDQLNLITFLSF